MRNVINLAQFWIAQETERDKGREKEKGSERERERGRVGREDGERGKCNPPFAHFHFSMFAFLVARDP
jgi:hypothetical protein